LENAQKFQAALDKAGVSAEALRDRLGTIVLPDFTAFTDGALRLLNTVQGKEGDFWTRFWTDTKTELGQIGDYYSKLLGIGAKAEGRVPGPGPSIQSLSAPDWHLGAGSAAADEAKKTTKQGTYEGTLQALREFSGGGGIWEGGGSGGGAMIGSGIFSPGSGIGGFRPRGPGASAPGGGGVGTRGDMMAPPGATGSQAMTTITSPSGKKLSVASEFAPNFQGFINDYEKAGGVLGPDTGGLGSRPGNASYHPLGRAIDVNQTGYGVRSKAGTTLPTETEDALAEKWGLRSGNTWRATETPAMRLRRLMVVGFERDISDLLSCGLSTRQAVRRAKICYGFARS
jgi:hypothetical protein